MLRQQLSRLGKTSLIYSVGGAMSGFLNLLLLPVFTKYLSPADYGVIALLNLLTLFLVPVLSLGLSTSIGICYFEKDDPQRKRQVIGTALLILLITGGTALLLGLVGAGAISRCLFNVTTYRYPVVITLVSIFFMIVAQPFMSYLQLEEKARHFAVLAVSSTVINLGSSLLLVIVLQRGVQGWVEGTVISQASCCLMYAFLGLRGNRLGFSRAIGRDLLRLGLPLVPSFAFLYVLMQENRFLLQRLAGTSAVGIFSVGASLGMIMTFLVSGFASAWMPYFMSFMQKPDEARPVFSRVMTYYVIGFGTATLVFYIFARPLVLLMTHPAFYGAAVAVGLSASTQFLMGVFSIFTTSVYFARETKWVSYIQGLAAFLSLPINYELVLHYRVLGAALGGMMNIALMAAILQAWNRLQGERYLLIAYEGPRILRFASLAAVVAVVTLLKPQFPLPQEIGIALLETLVTLALVWMQLTPSERGLFLSRMPLKSKVEGRRSKV